MSSVSLMQGDVSPQMALKLKFETQLPPRPYLGHGAHSKKQRDGYEPSAKVAHSTISANSMEALLI